MKVLIAEGELADLCNHAANEVSAKAMMIAELTDSPSAAAAVFVHCASALLIRRMMLHYGVEHGIEKEPTADDLRPYLKAAIAAISLSLGNNFNPEVRADLQRAAKEMGV